MLNGEKVLYKPNWRRVQQGLQIEHKDDSIVVFMEWKRDQCLEWKGKWEVWDTY